MQNKIYQKYRYTIYIMNKKIIEKLEKIKFTKRIEKVKFDLMEQHPYHLETYDIIPDKYLEFALDRTGNEPIYPPILVQNNKTYYIISGTGRIDHMIKKGFVECDCYILEILSYCNLLKTIRNR